jgi:ABC-type multidrug transport system permease subunit
MVGSTGAIYDRNTGYTIRLKTSKTFSVEYLFSKVIVFSGIAVLQTILLLLLFAVRGAEFDINFTGFAAAIFLITALNTLIGVTIGLVSENETIAILISLLFTLPFLFLSGIFAPIQLFPKFIQIFASFFPLGLEIEFLKKTSILGTNLSSIWYMVESMLNYITAFAVLNMILMRNKN